MTELKTLQYFLKSIMDPFYELHEVLKNPTHPEYNNLLLDLQKIDSKELIKYVEENDIDFLLGSTSNLDLERRTWFLSHCLRNDIAQKRMEILISGERPAPYNSDNLRNIPISEDKLVDFSLLKSNHSGITYNNYGYRLCPSTDADNSSYWLFLEIIKLVYKKQKSFYIRLDPFIEIPIDKYHPMMYKMTIYGRPLDWERLRSLHTDDFGQFMNEKEYGDYSNTDYIWHIEKNEIHFTCEELPKKEKCKYRGSRYFHAIFDIPSGNIIHCDGATRIYNESELNRRILFHVRNAEARKVGRRIKIFQTNDVLNQQDFSRLVVSFFVWNEDIRMYFS